jgi:hypothetical protein
MCEPSVILEALDRHLGYLMDEPVILIVVCWIAAMAVLGIWRSKRRER